MSSRQAVVINTASGLYIERDIYNLATPIITMGPVFKWLSAGISHNPLNALNKDRLGYPHHANWFTHVLDRTNVYGECVPSVRPAVGSVVQSLMSPKAESEREADT